MDILKSQGRIAKEGQHQRMGVLLAVILMAMREYSMFMV